MLLQIYLGAIDVLLWGWAGENQWTNRTIPGSTVLFKMSNSMCLKQMSLVDYERELDKAPFRTIDLFHSMIQT